MSRVTLAEYLAEYLASIGIRRVYGIIGTSVLDFVDALYSNREKIRYISARHEQVAVSMADAEYRVTGRIGATLVHAGPGFLNSMISLGIAYKDHVPLILISGGVKQRLKDTDSWLEIDQIRIASPVTKTSIRLNDPSDIEETMRILVKLAMRWPRGPVMLEVPEDMWRKTVEFDQLPSRIGELVDPPSMPQDSDVAETANELMSANKPLIYVSGEAIYKEDIQLVLEKLARIIDAYVVTSGNARGVCDENDPLCLGRVGFGGGSYPADKALEEADYVLVLGDELDDIATYSYSIYPLGEITIVSENPVVEQRPLYYSRLVKASPYYFTIKLLKELSRRGVSKNNEEWHNTMRKYKDKWNAILQDALKRKYKGYVNPSLFFAKLGEKLSSDDIVTAGQGTHIVYTYDFIKIRKPRRYLAATNLGAMGYAFPAAMGAKLALPDIQVIAIVGDGEFLMTLQDLETAVRENIPVKTIIVNDNSYRVLYLRQIMQKRGKVYGTLHGNPDFELLARSFGAEGFTLDNDDDIDKAIGEMLSSSKPFILNLKISKEDLPPLNLEGSLRMGG